MALPVLGIDVAKATLVVLLLISEHSERAEFANTSEGIAQVLAWLRKHNAGRVHACLEATGTYGEELAQTLHDAGHTVSVVNPARIVAYGRSQLARNKTDQADAALIARFCQKEQPAAWIPPSPELRDLRALVRHLEAVQQMRQAEANRLSAGTHPAAIQQALQNHLTFLDKQIATLISQIDDQINRHPELRHQRDLLVSIKGIGKRTAAKLLAELGDIRAFGSARELAAYAGLNPRQFTSGSSIHRRTRLSKIGNAAVRAALFFPAIVAKRHNPIVRAFCLRLSERGMVPMAVVGAAMRKLLHIVYGVVTKDTPFDPAYLTRRPTAG